MKKTNIKFLGIILIYAVFLVLAVTKADKKLTYIEYTSFNKSNDSWIMLESPTDELKQEFIMPYDIFDGVALQIGTFMRDNNSNWLLTISDAESGETLCSSKFETINIIDNSYFTVEPDAPVKLTRNHKYVITVSPIHITSDSALAFYVSDSSDAVENADLYYNDEMIDGDLCFKVYGGNKDNWWTFFTFLIFAFIFAVILKFYFLEKSGKKFCDDSVLQAMLLGIAIFILLVPFSNAMEFTDESDNMYGGMVIANGGVLYKNYVTQHTPLGYYLCSVFAMLGAGSIAQFRLSYYLLESVIWGLMYIRHSNVFGKKKMAVLPFAEILCIPSLIYPYGSQILSDGIQGILSVILLLEFLQYYKDKRLNIKRSIIISLCIWGCIGAAFISLYALIWLVLIVMITEVLKWREQKLTFISVIKRYVPFLIVMLIPPIAAVIYFWSNNAFLIAVEQFYTFNREVYPNYVGLGDNLIQPFVDGAKNYFSYITDGVLSIINGSSSSSGILGLMLLVISSICLYVSFIKNKRYMEAAALFLMMIFSATRGYSFHGLPAWYISVMIIVLSADKMPPVSKITKTVYLSTGFVLISIFIGQLGTNILFTQTAVSELESEVIALTENSVDNDIYLDAWTSGSLYYFYKERYPVNSAVFMLPWYMDWYENKNICDLRERKPDIVVYNEDEETWGYQYYSAAFVNELTKNYTRISDSGWGYYVWQRNPETN